MWRCCACHADVIVMSCQVTGNFLEPARVASLVWLGNLRRLILSFSCVLHPASFFFLSVLSLSFVSFTSFIRFLSFVTQDADDYISINATSLHFVQMHVFLFNFGIFLLQKCYILFVALSVKVLLNLVAVYVAYGRRFSRVFRGLLLCQPSATTSTISSLE